ncbi:hypothetical protein J8273_7382 [Carpediemonas membranifera]|uniref:Uncharacterized protein n=1 Tax=Carpediemonas membranifera TaxID=201153 RepID=A0A8J6AQJ5_9EUKA|nr:hypothetical protein J8273_7382 [Carpediemonas membranifera]|eukprot:KAG9391108.1 hypothetical protein J8273_7382 [Carpediemonas membranifera]
MADFRSPPSKHIHNVRARENTPQSLKDGIRRRMRAKASLERENFMETLRTTSIQDVISSLAQQEKSGLAESEHDIDLDQQALEELAQELFAMQEAYEQELVQRMEADMDEELAYLAAQYDG